jgi:tetratricopeptide (TPR) repeat protein
MEKSCIESVQAGHLISKTAYYLHSRGQYTEAEPLFLRAIMINREALGEGHPDYAASLNNLAGLYRATGRNAEAEPLFLRAMEINREALGERHPAYAASLNNLAELYRATGRHGEAEPLFLRAMEINREALGERHPAYAASLNNLAELYRATGRNAEAELELAIPILYQGVTLQAVNMEIPHISSINTILASFSIVQTLNYETFEDARLGQLCGPSERPPISRQAQSLRNSPCSCGSGKKFKKCCWRS